EFCQSRPSTRNRHVGKWATLSRRMVFPARASARIATLRSRPTTHPHLRDRHISPIHGSAEPLQAIVSGMHLHVLPPPQSTTNPPTEPSSSTPTKPQAPTAPTSKQSTPTVAANEDDPRLRLRRRAKHRHLLHRHRHRPRPAQRAGLPANRQILALPGHGRPVHHRTLRHDQTSIPNNSEQTGEPLPRRDESPPSVSSIPNAGAAAEDRGDVLHRNGTAGPVDEEPASTSSSRAFGQQRCDGPANRSVGSDPAMKPLRNSVKEWLIHNTIQNSPEVKGAMQSVFSRRRDEG
ncbi:3195_t:CDS:2, partial [Scutellospora calospora]